MIVDINEHNSIRLKEVYELVELCSTSGESIFVSMRDGGFEILVENTSSKEKSYTPYSIRDGKIELLAMSVLNSPNKH